MTAIEKARAAAVEDDLPALVDLLDTYHTARQLIEKIDAGGAWVWPDGWKPLIDRLREQVQR